MFDRKNIFIQDNSYLSMKKLRIRPFGIGTIMKSSPLISLDSK